VIRHFRVTPRHCWAALAAVSELPAVMRQDRSGSTLLETARLCRTIEAEVGRDAGIGEKLGSLLLQARSYDLAEGQSDETARRARLIFLADCWSLRAIIDRLSVE